MNILFLTSTFPYGGKNSQASFVQEQALTWAKKCPHDKIFILAPYHKDALRQETIGPLRVFRYAYWFPSHYASLAYPAILPNLKRNPWLILQLPSFLACQLVSALRICTEHHIDLIYAHWVMPQGFIAWLISHLKKVPFVLHNHSSDLRIFLKIPFIGWRIAAKILSAAQHICCVNQTLKTEAARLYPEATEKINVLPMGVPLSLIENNDDIPETSYDLGFLGRLSSKKGVQHLLKTLQMICTNSHRLRVGIAGDGELRQELEHQAQTLNNVEIHFLGFLNNEDKKSFLQRTRVMVFPSLEIQGDIEGLPVSLLESLVMGKQVIASRATNITQLPEWESIQEKIILLNNPEDHHEFAQALHQGLMNTTFSDETLRHLMGRYLWPNLMDDYFTAFNITTNPKKP